MKLRFLASATTPVVPDPRKGPSIIPSSGHPAKTQGSTSSDGTWRRVDRGKFRSLVCYRYIRRLECGAP